MTDSLDFLNGIPDAKEKPSERKSTRKSKQKTYTRTEFEELLTKLDLTHGPGVEKEGSIWYTLEQCPLCGHSGSKPAVSLNKDGEAGFHCFHPDCTGKRWKDFEARFEPTLEEVQARVTRALEGLRAQDLYDLAEEIARLEEKDQLVIISQVRTSKDLKAAGISVRDLQKLITAEKQVSRASQHDAEGNYCATPEGMFVLSRYGPEKISNFEASIEADVTTDDGAERTRSYQLAARLHDRQRTFEVPAKEFAACTWVDEHLGARAIVTTGQSMKSHLINAIKSTSTPQEHFHYAHTGWRKIDGKMVYLHAGGALSEVSEVPKRDLEDFTQRGASNEIASRAGLEKENSSMSEVSEVSEVNIGVQVKLTGNLTRYQFPAHRTEIQQAVCASLRYLDVAGATIVMPLYASLWRSVLGDLAYGVHIAGQTGFGKTELVAPLQQHFGASMSAHKLPGSWESTENALELLLFQAKDTLVVVDDFKPKGGKMDQDRLHAKADRVFRQIGNGSARGRLNSNLEQRAERRPRCLLISTGEDIPRGQSLKARGVVLVLSDRLTVGQSAVSLSIAQRDARAGLYASAMAHYIEWLAPQIEAIQAKLPDLVAEERDRLKIEGHGRAGTNTANMLIGMKYFLQFATECGAITEQEASDYLTRCIAALKQIASDAESENTQDKPSEQWLRLITTALASKQAHLVTAKGDNPGQEYGWAMSTRTVEHDGVSMPEETYRGGGAQIGWIDGDDIYLDPIAAYKAAKAIGSQTGDEITTLEPTLRKFLVQDKMLASTDLTAKRPTIAVRRRLENLQRYVLHLRAKILFPDDDPTSKNSLHSLHSEPSEDASEVGSEVSAGLHSEDIECRDSNDYEDASEVGSEVSEVLHSENPHSLHSDMTQEGVSSEFASQCHEFDRMEKALQALRVGQWVNTPKSGRIIRKDAYGLYIDIMGGETRYFTGSDILSITAKEQVSA